MRYLEMHKDAIIYQFITLYGFDTLEKGRLTLAFERIQDIKTLELNIVEKEFDKFRKEVCNNREVDIKNLPEYALQYKI